MILSDVPLLSDVPRWRPSAHRTTIPSQSGRSFHALHKLHKASQKKEEGMCFQCHRSRSITVVVGGSGQTARLTIEREAECIECGMRASTNNVSTGSKDMSTITYITINEASLERVKHNLKIT
jgi:hypothetical protein